MSGTAVPQPPDPEDDRERLHPVPAGLEDSAHADGRSWGRVYAVVVGVFILWVALLTVFMRTYS